MTLKSKPIPVCKFCESLKIHGQVDTIARKDTPEQKIRYSVALVRRTFYKGRRGGQGVMTDFRHKACGYALNYCPECGKSLMKNTEEEDETDGR